MAAPSAQLKKCRDPGSIADSTTLASRTVERVLDIVSERGQLAGKRLRPCDREMHERVRPERLVALDTSRDPPLTGRVAHLPQPLGASSDHDTITRLG
jgi:hypothetical protein